MRFRASLDPAAGAGPGEGFRLIQVDLRASYKVVPAVAVLVGASRRWISPEFAAPDVGFVRLGLLTETAVTRQARVWVRGAYAVAPHFNGGGSAGSPSRSGWARGSERPPAATGCGSNTTFSGSTAKSTGRRCRSRWRWPGPDCNWGSEHMKVRMRARSKIGPTLLSLLAACLSASDEGGGLRLDVTPIPRLIRGDSAQVHAQLLGEDGVPIPNARFAYSSTDNSVAVVSTGGLVIAVSPGAADIRVQSLGTERTPAVEAAVAVSPSVSLDSLRPVAARWGQLLSLYGSGLGPDTGQTVTINDVPVTVESYQPADSLHPERFGVLQVVAAPPLETGTSDTDANVIVTTARGAAALSTPLAIDSVDVFWPNTLTPADLGTITSRREFPGLALEPPQLTDWFSFSTAAPGDWTVRLSREAEVSLFPAGQVEAEQLQSTTPGSSASTFIAYYPGRGSVAGSASLCNGRGVWIQGVFLPRPFSTGFSGAGFRGLTLRNVPPGQHDLIVTFTGLTAIAPSDPGSFGSARAPFPARRANEWAVVATPFLEPLRARRYDLVIEPWAGSDIARDAYEPNDVCEDAISPFLTLGSSGFTDSVVDLSFDGPGDIDWFRIVAETHGFLQIRSPETAGSAGGELVPSATDSAVVAGALDFIDPCTDNSLTGALWSEGPDGCAVDGVRLQSGAYYLITGSHNPDIPGPYQLTFTWSPGAPLAPRIAAGHR